MKAPEITIIMPAYNHEQFVGEAIESVLSQTFENFELIIINDGSTDKTESVIKRYGDPRIRYYHQENKGSCHAHTRGIQLAGGEYISIIDSDDVYHPERLSVLLDTAKNGDLDFLITDLNLIDQHSAIIDDPDHWWIKWYEHLKLAYRTSDSPDKALLSGNFTITTSNFFFNSRLVQEIGAFKPYTYILDYDFAFRAARNRPGSFVFLDDRKLLSYRLHGQNTILKNPLVANYETFYFLVNAIKDVFGPDMEIPVEHLNKIRRYLVKELTLRRKNDIAAVRRDLMDALELKSAELAERSAELAQKSTELEFASQEVTRTVQELREQGRRLSDEEGFNQRLLTEFYFIKNSFSFKIGRLFTLPLRTLRRNPLKPMKAEARDIRDLRTKLDPIVRHVDVISFDIFDTIFERDIDPPDKVKEIVARRVAAILKEAYHITRSPLELLRLRDSIELKLRRDALKNGSDYECRYSDIVKEMVTVLLGEYDEKLYNEMIEEEIKVEDEVLYVKEGMRELLEELRDRGKRIIAISDMYLDKEHVRRILQLKSLDFFFRDIYVSSESGICKYSGNLFRHVLLRERVLPGQMVHIGDNRISDHRVPMRLGIHTIYLKDASHLKRKYVLKTYNRLAAKNSYWKGRHLLQLVRPFKGREDFFYSYGFSFLGPVYSAFVYGVIETIKKQNIRKVYFLAREGELFLRLFNTFESHFFEKGAAPDTEYVYLTRKSTALASAYQGLSHQKAIIALYNPKQQGLQSICDVFGLPSGEFRDIAGQYGLTDMRRPLYDWYDERFKKLLMDGRLQDIVRRHARADRELLARYLEQIGFFNDSPVAFVDVGWNATIQKFVQDAFIERADYPHIYGLYLGFIDGIKHAFEPQKNTIQGFFYDDLRNDPAEKILSRFAEIFEEGARAMHPTTIGYRHNPGTGLVEPVFKNDRAYDRTVELLHNGKIAQIQRGALSFSMEFIRAVHLTGYSFEDIRPFLLTLIERCIAFPRSEETKILMDLKHSEDFGYENVMDFTSDRINSLKTILHPGKFVNKIKHSNWPYGTARSSGIPGINLGVRLYDLLWRP